MDPELMRLAAILLVGVRRASALTAGLLLAPQGIGALPPRTLAGRPTAESAPGPSCWPAWRSRPRADAFTGLPRESVPTPAA
jgi:hypothetical protein